MHLIIDGKIRIQNARWSVKQDIKKYLTIVNPQYQMAINMVKKNPGKRKMLYAMKPEFKYYEEDGNDLIVGRGLGNLLDRMCKTNKIKYTFEINRVDHKVASKLKESIKLRDYQPGVATKILDYNQGILELGTAWGKTILAFRLVEKTQLKTLIICCKSELDELNKYKVDFKKIYKQNIGVIRGKTKVIRDVTVSTASSIVKADLNKIKSEFGMIIVDECHVGMSEKRLQVFSQFNPSRFYGMSATPGRANGQSKALSFYYGDTLVEEKLPGAIPDVHIYKTDFETKGDTYSKMEDDIINSHMRNNLIVSIINELIQQKRRILILTKRVEHGKILQRMLKNSLKLNAIALSSNDDSKIRSNIIQELRNEKRDFKVLIGTYGLFSTGIDIPLIDSVLLGMSIKVDGDYDATLIQSCGRGLRKHEQKNKPLIIDIHDNLNKIMHRHYLSRLRVYKREGWEFFNKSI